MTLFTYFFIPETKGLLIEDVHEVFAAHWFWKRLGAVAHHKVRFSDLGQDLGGRRCFAGVLCIRMFLQRFQGILAVAILNTAAAERLCEPGSPSSFPTFVLLALGRFRGQQCSDTCFHVHRTSRAAPAWSAAWTCSGRLPWRPACPPLGCRVPQRCRQSPAARTPRLTGSDASGRLLRL